MSKDQPKTHIVARILYEAVWYPAHAKRVETTEYKKIHNKLTRELDLPCLVCGVKNSTLTDPTENKYKSKQMETHHHVIEWAAANSIDVNKFNKIILPHLKQLHPLTYPGPLTEQEMLDWIDHSPHNLWVLCDVHHRKSRYGIHMITGPIWGAQDLIKDGIPYIDTTVVKSGGNYKE